MRNLTNRMKVDFDDFGVKNQRLLTCGTAILPFIKLTTQDREVDKFRNTYESAEIPKRKEKKYFIRPLERSSGDRLGV